MQLENYLQIHLPSLKGRNVFVDEQCVVGRNYENQLCYAFDRSAMFVPILDAQYFFSDWCKSEWMAFKGREDLCKVQGLICPIQVGGEVYFTKDAKDRLPLDFGDFLHTSKCFVGTRKYLEFERSTRDLAKRIASFMSEVPRWNDGFPRLHRPPDGGEPPSPHIPFPSKK
jgi:hypothetical protein